ncbi:4-hydroxybenzoate octaprenyltransferase [Candidatus Kirkpatrickella diaphorinae]|uniref:4-hydroxybenzoate octaprenyltransferase n=1 Tax=Candidatus Kirkpatrickella diaphorinae TaxID=2984322 RepID=A0ABY6GM91_9PROT|nr:4-hydroxybenzoate octaprenyltransferase [Candidatus Kirkpatrickella diaphorinae]UYH52236.1 4-hydroxybenzoate octaprenyltransferase [Candidatus Kirkpatrickella diaphorinae]
MTQGWVRYFPRPVRPYLLLARLDRPVGTWLLFLPGFWGILLARPVMDGTSLRLILLFALGALVMRSAGCVVNDLWDRDIDAQVARTAVRPLASGQIRVKNALLFLAVLLALGCAVLAQLPVLCWYLAPIALLLVAFYPAAKRVTWWPQLVMGFTFGFGAPMGYAAAAARLDMTAFCLYAGTIFWQLGFDTIYGFQDIEDDARIGVKSTSLLWRGKAKFFVTICYALATILFTASALLAEVDGLFWPCGAFATLILIYQIFTLRPDDPPHCLKLFKSNVLYGLALAASLVIGRIV